VLGTTPSLKFLLISRSNTKRWKSNLEHELIRDTSMKMIDNLIHLPETSLGMPSSAYREGLILSFP